MHHPGLDATVLIGNKKYCQRCELSLQQADKLLPQDIVPRECFVWYKGGNVWEAIRGTGCAHWVAHQLGIKQGAAIHRCLEGFTIKVPDLIRGKTKISLDKVTLGDIYVNPAISQCGLVSKIIKVPGNVDKIEIQHSSSRQNKVAKNDFASYFGGRGTFYR